MKMCEGFVDLNLAPIHDGASHGRAAEYKFYVASFGDQCITPSRRALLLQKVSKKGTCCGDSLNARHQKAKTLS